MSGWGYGDDGDVEATPDAWGTAPSSRRVSNIAKDSLFSPDEESPNEWAGAGAGGRWGGEHGKTHETDDEGAGAWGAQENAEDGDTRGGDWGRSGVDDETMSFDGGEARQPNDNRGWGIPSDDDQPSTSAVGWGDSGDLEEEEDMSNPSSLEKNKENVVSPVMHNVASPPLSPSPMPLPIPAKRKHGWKSNWAVEGLARSKQNGRLSASSIGHTSTEEKKGITRKKRSPSPEIASIDDEGEIPTSEPKTIPRNASNPSRVVPEPAIHTTDNLIASWGSDYDSEDELLAESGLTQAGETNKTPNRQTGEYRETVSPEAARQRAASLKAAVAAKKPFEIGVPPGATVDSDSDDFGIAVTTRGRGSKKKATPKPKPKPAAKEKPSAKKTVKSKKPDVPKTKTKTPTRVSPEVHLLDDEFSDDVVGDSELEGDDLDDGFVMEPEGNTNRYQNRGTGDCRSPSPDVEVERENNNTNVGLGGPMSRLPRKASPPPTAAWRQMLPHFTPASSLKKGEYMNGEKVFIDYHGQFEGGAGGGASGGNGNGNADASGRWFRDGGLNKFVDVDGEVLEGRAAWRASEKQKKTVAANGRARR